MRALPFLFRHLLLLRCVTILTKTIRIPPVYPVMTFMADAYEIVIIERKVRMIAQLLDVMHHHGASDPAVRSVEDSACLHRVADPLPTYLTFVMIAFQDLVALVFPDRAVIKSFCFSLRHDCSMDSKKAAARNDCPSPGGLMKMRKEWCNGCGSLLSYRLPY